MKTVINGVEITSKMSEVLKSWYEDCTSIEDTFPYYFVEHISLIQDYLTGLWLDRDDNDPDVPKLKNYLNTLMFLKSQLKMFIPESKDEQQFKNKTL
ncbi:MAG: hypothetical protein LBG28_10615 [Tannerella sp.]|jgi:hypothetical protein|nr:hypothetical protein [Tannerella sp.]